MLPAHPWNWNKTLKQPETVLAFAHDETEIKQNNTNRSNGLVFGARKNWKSEVNIQRFSVYISRMGAKSPGQIEPKFFWKKISAP